MQPYSRANNQGEEVTVEKGRQQRALFEEVKMSAPRRQSTGAVSMRTVYSRMRPAPHVAETMIGGADVIPLSCQGAS
jgi:hypothetical protein